MAFEIRPVDPGEVEAVAALARRIWLDAYAGIISRAQIDYMLTSRYGVAQMRRELASPGCWWDLAWLGGERAGFAATRLADEAGVARLDKLYVEPGRQRSGLGGALIAAAEAHARCAGCTRLVLAVNKRNARALAAYRKHGFAVAEAVCVDIGNGFVMDDFIMAKSLAGGAVPADR